MKLIVFLAILAISMAVGIALQLAGQRKRRHPGDADVLEGLRRAGSDLSRTHSVEFFLHFPTREIALQAAESLSAEGFGTSVGPGAGSSYQILLATKDMVPVESELAAIRSRFTALAAASGGSYEGWAASVVLSGGGA